MKKVEIRLVGCDAETAFSLEVAEEEMNLLQALVEGSAMASSYHCEPKMYYRIEE